MKTWKPNKDGGMPLKQGTTRHYKAVIFKEHYIIKNGVALSFSPMT